MDQKLTGDEEIDAMLRWCIETFHRKGADYTQGSVDRLKNFRDVARDTDQPMIKAWYTYAYKHWSAVVSFVKHGQVESEPIEDRLMDVIVYCLLATKIVKEMQREAKS